MKKFTGMRNSPSIDQVKAGNVNSKNIRMAKLSHIQKAKRLATVARKVVTAAKGKVKNDKKTT